jgi:hypothetical protein
VIMDSTCFMQCLLNAVKAIPYCSLSANMGRGGELAVLTRVSLLYFPSRK